MRAATPAGAGRLARRSRLRSQAVPMTGMFLLVLLQLLDLHSSLIARSAVETNALVKGLAVHGGLPVALVLAKLVGLAGVGCLYRVWRRFPGLRAEVTWAVAIATAFYAVVVVNNYGVQP